MSDNPFIHKEAFHLLAGELLGSGVARHTYASKLLPDCVVKVESGSGSFQNIMEWETWDRVRGTDQERWFAPCRWISACGSVLIMDRTRPATPAEFPDRMPVFLTDLKRTNYGVIEQVNPKTKKRTKRFVCHDYGVTLLMENGMTKRMRKANWWDLE